MSACTSANLTANTGFVYLRFANQDARLHGFDLSGFADLGKSAQWGQFTLSGMLNYRATARTAPRATTSTTSCR
jgi:iron complex outermembrane receptor protein